MNNNWQYPPFMNTRIDRRFNILQNKPPNGFKRPQLQHSVRNGMSGIYSNNGVTNYPTNIHQHIPRMMYRNVPVYRHSVPIRTYKAATCIPQRPQLFLLPHNTFQNKSNQYSLPELTNSKMHKVALETPVKYGSCHGLNGRNSFSDIRSNTVQRPPCFYPNRTIQAYQNNQYLMPNATINTIKLKTESINYKIQSLDADLHPKSVESPIPVNQYNIRNRNEHSIKFYNVQNLPVPRENVYLNVHNSFQNEQQHFPVINFASGVSSNNCIIGSNNVSANVYNPPAPVFFPSTAENIKNNFLNCNIGFVMPPPLFYPTVVGRSEIKTEVIDQYNTNSTQNNIRNNNIVEYNSSNVTYDLTSTKNHIFDECNQKEGLYQEITDCNMNVTENSSLTNKICDHSINAAQNTFIQNQIIEPRYVCTIDKENCDSKETAPNTLANCNNVSKYHKFDGAHKISIKAEPCINGKNIDNIDLFKNKTEIAFQQLSSKVDPTMHRTDHNTKTDDSEIDKTTNISSVIHSNKTQQTDKSRPACCIQVPGTHWYVVWTGDERFFFYESQRKVSVWEKPKQLYNRSDVDKMVQKSPFNTNPQVLAKPHQETPSESSTISENVRNGMKKVDSSIHNENSDTTLSYSREERVKIFCEMLEERNVSHLSTWEKEVSKVILDSRYAVLPETEHGQIYLSYCKRKFQEEKNDPRKSHQLLTQQFLSLLIEAGVTSESVFSDIVKYYAEDVRFKAIKSIELKEFIFNKYTLQFKENCIPKQNFENYQGNITDDFSSERKTFHEWTGDKSKTVIAGAYNSANRKNLLECTEDSPLIKKHRRLINLENHQQVNRDLFYDLQNDSITSEVKNSVAHEATSGRYNNETSYNITVWNSDLKKATGGSFNSIYSM